MYIYSHTRIHKDAVEIKHLIFIYIVVLTSATFYHTIVSFMPLSFSASFCSTQISSLSLSSELESESTASSSRLLRMSLATCSYALTECGNQMPSVVTASENLLTCHCFCWYSGG